MDEIKLSVKPMTKEIMSFLEEKNLIQRMLPTKKALNAGEGEVVGDYLYKTDSAFGSHAFICVGYNSSIVNLATHSQKEDWILINEGRQQKPLVMIIGLHPNPDFQKIISEKKLTSDDLWAIEMKFNDPELSFFTMNENTPHCEWTIPGDGPANIFYVSEPSSLDICPLEMENYKIIVDHS